MNHTFRRVLDLVRRTGDRMVVVDPERDEAFVIMGLEEYEALAGAMQHELPASRVSSAPAAPPMPPVSRPARAPEPAPRLVDVMQPAGEPSATWDLSSMTPEERQEVVEAFQEYSDINSSPTSAEKEEIPVIDALSEGNEDDFGEEQFYLEPVE